MGFINMVMKQACEKLGIHSYELSPAFIIGDRKICGIMWETARVYEYRCRYCGESFKTFLYLGERTF